MRGECWVKSVVYKATVTYNDTLSVYIGLTGGSFKDRYRNHVKSERHIRYEKETELSKYIWSLKRREIDYTFRWDIIKKSNTNRRKSGQCNLCLEEKFAFITCKNKIINKRLELISKCRHSHNKVKKPPDRGR